MAEEYKGVVFAISFILFFSALVSSIPSDLSGETTTVNSIIPIDSGLVSNFSSSVDYIRTDFDAFSAYYYDLGDYSWVTAHTAQPAFTVSAKILVGGVLWLGSLSYCKFISPEGTDRGNLLTIDEIEADADDGTVQYSLIFEDNGNSAGGFIFYWNTTTYSDPKDAWDNDVLYLLHGVGLSTNIDIALLLIQLLTLQLPEVPILLGILLVTPLWASIAYLLWWFIISMIPFLSAG